MANISPGTLGRIFEAPFQDSDVKAISTSLIEDTDPQVIAQVAE